MNDTQQNITVYHDVAPLYDIPPHGVVILITIYFMVAFSAIFGNSVILYVIIKSPRLKGVTNFFIANLASADIMIAALAVPFNFQAALLQKWLLPHFMCSFCPFIQNVSLNVSIFTLVAVALDRYRAVVHPLRARTSHLKIKLCIAPIWLFAILLSIPTFIGLKVEMRIDPNTGQDIAICNMIGMDTEYWTAYNHFLVGFQYFLPLVIISFAYTYMGIKLFADRTPVTNSRSDSGQVNENRKKVVKIMMIVVLLFGLSWLPFQMYNVLAEVYPDINNYYYINVIWFGCHLLAMSNSFYNPIIYYFNSEVYNSEIKKHFGFICRNFGRGGVDYPHSDADNHNHHLHSNADQTMRTVILNNSNVNTPDRKTSRSTAHHAITRDSDNKTQSSCL